MLRTLLLLIIAGLYSNTAAAAAFQLLEQNASGLGNAYAGSAAVAADASTIFFNPAGMTQLQPHAAVVALSAIRLSLKFTDNGASTGALGGASSGGNGGDAGSWGKIPSGYFSWALNKNIVAGLGLNAPFGLLTEYDADWLGRFQSIKFEIKTYNINPTLAYRVSDTVSVGVGLDWQRLKAEYSRQAALPPTFTATAPVTLDMDDAAWGWNIGMLYQPNAQTRLGLAYRSSINFSLAGDTTGALNLATTATIQTPDTVILSIAQTLNDRWQLLGDLSWTGWSSIDAVNIHTSTGALLQTLDTQFDNTWRIAVGSNYQYNTAWKIRFGLAYDQTPVPDAAHRLTSLPDSNRIWLTTGTQWQLNKATTLDLGAAYLNLQKTSINNNQTTTAQGLVAGRYDSSKVYILGLQYSVAF